MGETNFASRITPKNIGQLYQDAVCYEITPDPSSNVVQRFRRRDLLPTRGDSCSQRFRHVDRATSDSTEGTHRIQLTHRRASWR